MTIRFKFCLLILLMTFLPLQAGAAELKIAVIDANLLMNTSKAAQSIKAQLETQRSKFQSEFTAAEKALKAKEEALMKERSKLSEAELRTKVQAFRAEMAKEQQLFQGKKAALDKAFSNALKSLQASIRSVAKTLAEEKGLNLVASKDSILYYDQSFDMTAALLQKLDQTTPSVTVKVGE